nr:TIGR01777 family oxidoreductase [Pleionea sp. CnH1-48]
MVTGGTGFVGRALIEILKQQHEVIVLTRDLLHAQRLFTDEIKCVSDYRKLDASQINAVINLAGAPIADKRWSAKRVEELRGSRIQLTRELANWLKFNKAELEVFLSASAVGFYGRQGHRFVDEQTTPVDEFTHQLCNDWEKEALLTEAFCRRVCCMRFGLVVGADGGFLQKMLLPFKLGLGGRLGNGEQYMSWVHLSDVVKTMIFLLEHPTCQGVFNVTAPHPVTNTEFTQTLAKVLNRPAFCHVPAFVLQTALGEMSDLLLTGQRVIPERLKQAGFEFEYEDLEKALREVI